MSLSLPVTEERDSLPAADDTATPSAGWEMVKRALAPYASLKITVVLFALSIALVFFGTLAQVDKDIWEVIHEYFRCFFVWVPVKIFFPPAFFAGKPPEIPDTWIFPFPGGWTIGVALWTNLFAAHVSRFTVQAKGTDRVWGSIALLAGIVVTWLVIDSGSSVAGVLKDYAISWNALWTLMLLTLGIAFLGAVYGTVQMRSDQKAERWVLGGISVLFGALLGFFFYQGSDWRPDDAGMRILWQLVKGTMAGLVLLAGCWMLFRKRAGIVLLHAGIGLMMFNELYVGVTNVEGQMQIDEGQTVNFVQDIRTVELAIIDRSGAGEDKVTVIPVGHIRQAAKNETLLSNDLLPFDVKPVRWMQNSNLRRAAAGDENPATDGAGKYWIPEEVRPGSGTDKDSKVDIPSAYLTFYKKGSDKPLGTRLLSLESAARNEPERITVDGHDYDVFLRFKRNYKPYSLTLLDVQKNDYLGTSTPRDYRSKVHLVDPTRKTDLKSVDIWMNNPLRFAGETFYQSGYFARPTMTINPVTGRREQKVIEMTTLSVVSNAQWMIPYVGCMIVLVGMLAQFGITLARFLKRQDTAVLPSREAFAEFVDANQVELEPTSRKRRGGRRKDRDSDVELDVLQPVSPLASFANSRWAIPLVVVLIAGGYVGSKARTPRPPEGAMDYNAFGRLPLVEQGRVKPFDTVARNSLSIISGGRQEYVDADGKKQPAVRWLLDVIADENAAEKHKVFRIDNRQVQSMLGLSPRKESRYSIDELRPKIEDFNAAVEQARKLEAGQRDVVQRKLLELDGRIRTYTLLHAAFHPPPLPPLPTREQIVQKSPDAPGMVAEFHGAVTDFGRRLNEMHAPLGVSNRLSEKQKTFDGKDPEDWETYSVAWARAFMMKELIDEAPPAGLAMLNKIIVYYAKGNADEFNKAVADYESSLSTTRVPELNVPKVRFEAFFNRFSPFFYAAWMNVLAFALAALAWLGWSVPLNRASFWLIVVSLVVHTFGLIARMYISGRPPVTNLYSSAVFIGWGAVILGLVLEAVFKMGIGNIIGSISGFSTLLIAHILSGDGDTFTVLQAVLDTQFWLATHVTCITFGYATTFVAGLLGVLYIVLGICTPRLTKETGREITRMIYGILCFATFFSFVGTVLGGLWADDSWGRFWGWDPKENGALIIVLWNALVLHARWGNMVKDRGLAVLAVGGNIVTSWSWFGVNELGVGLHSYGFTEGVLRTLALFVLSQLAIGGLGCLPKSAWWSTRAAVVNVPGSSVG